MTTWLVIGAGVSGIGAARWLASLGHTVRISEHGAIPDTVRAELRHAGIVDVRAGGHRMDHLAGIEAVVLSPGLAPTHPLITAAQKQALPVHSEIDLGVSAYLSRKPTGRILGVTGTNGKSTTCAMLGHILRHVGKDAEIGGNFGLPPTAMLANGRYPDWLVLELSSYQLEQSAPLPLAGAIFTSLSNDHLARHGTYAAYVSAKWRLFAALQSGGIAVLPGPILDEGLRLGLRRPLSLTLAVRDQALAAQDCLLSRDGTVTLPDELAVKLPDLGIITLHDQLNAALALCTLSKLLDLPISDLAPGLKIFRGLAHRCEVIGRRDSGAAIINDSKSTNVEATLVALASQREPVLLLMGGQGKGEPYSPLRGQAAKIDRLVTFGPTGPEIAAALCDLVPVTEYPTLKSALAAISGIIKSWNGPILFSPGCASFDEFRNFEERGAFFRNSMSSMLVS